MGALESFQAELTLKVAEIDELCAKYKYAGVPTLLLRHPEGVALSILIGNDCLEKAVGCITELGNIGEESIQSPAEAVLSLLNGRS